MIDPERGYDPDDQFYYSRGLVAELLPIALNGPELPASGLTDGPGAQGDPAEGGNVQVMILDVRRVVPLMTESARYAAVYAVVRGEDIPPYALDEIVEMLGGPKP